MSVATVAPLLVARRRASDGRRRIPTPRRGRRDERARRAKSRGDVATYRVVDGRNRSASDLFRFAARTSPIAGVSRRPRPATRHRPVTRVAKGVARRRERRGRDLVLAARQPPRRRASTPPALIAKGRGRRAATVERSAVDWIPPRASPRDSRLPRPRAARLAARRRDDAERCHVVVVVRGSSGGSSGERGGARSASAATVATRARAVFLGPSIVRFVVRREDSERAVEDLATQRRRIGLEAFAGVLQRVQAVLRSLGDLGVGAGERGSRAAVSFVRSGGRRRMTVTCRFRRGLRGRSRWIWTHHHGRARRVAPAATSSRRNPRHRTRSRAPLCARSDQAKNSSRLIKKNLETSVRLATCHSASPPPRPPRAGPFRPLHAADAPGAMSAPTLERSPARRAPRRRTATGCPRVRATRSPREAAVATCDRSRAPDPLLRVRPHRRGVAGYRAARDVRVERRDRQAEDRTRGHQRDRRGESRRDRRDDPTPRVVRS